MENTINNSGIRFLLHFTQAKNLESIFQHGILPISELQSKEIAYSYNDNYRIDGCHDASCLSIEMPNYKMFYKYRNENPELDWVVLGIKKELLWEKDCAFCIENAASNSITQTTLESRKGIQAFNRLFDEFPNKPTRQALNLNPIVPTHPQAEVLVFDNIEPAYIFTACFENDFLFNKYKHLVPATVNTEVQKWLYEPRHDYVHW